MSSFPGFFLVSLLLYPLKEHMFIYSFCERPSSASCVCPPGSKDLIQYPPVSNAYSALGSETSFDPGIS